MRQSAEGKILQEDSLDPALLALAIFSLAAIVLLLWRLPHDQTESDSTDRGELTKAAV